MSNTHTNIVKRLFQGPCTRQELVEAGGGKSATTRIYEINKMYSDMEIVKVDNMFMLNFKGTIKIDPKRVYPNLRKKKACV